MAYQSHDLFDTVLCPPKPSQALGDPPSLRRWEEMLYIHEHDEGLPRVERGVIHRALLPPKSLR
jgi:hypothetical protein